MSRLLRLERQADAPDQFLIAGIGVQVVIGGIELQFEQPCSVTLIGDIEVSHGLVMVAGGRVEFGMLERRTTPFFRALIRVRQLRVQPTAVAAGRIRTPEKSI